MGRYYYSKRTTVDECKSLSIKFLKERKYLESGFRWGTVTWSRNGNQTGSISISTTIDEHPIIRLWYTRTSRQTEEKRDLDYNLDLETTPCHYGGKRWWFICWHCKRRCSTIYLNESDIFLCRRCNNLAYESQNQNRRGVWFQVGKILDLDERGKLPQSRGAYEFYKGKPTRNYLKLLHTYHELERADSFLYQKGWYNKYKH